MANPRLTRAEATDRAAQLEVTSYDVALDLTTSAQTFTSRTLVRFRARTPGSATWIDLVAERIDSALLNGEPVGLEGYDGQRLELPALAAANELIIEGVFRYSRTGEGLHRLVDPVDNEVYLYTQFETADAQRMYACFDEPDLKATFAFSVTAPAHWEVISNSPTPTPVAVSAGIARWDFPPTPGISTYITALIAGPYRGVRDTYEGTGGVYPLGVFTRASMFEYLDAQTILTETKQGFAYFEAHFDHPYPFAKYDQVFTPEFNAGAMENAGAVTIMEDFVFRSRVTDSAYEQRANTILHELAHMWFGDLVTMTWWDDLWLNESFAEWASHHAMAAATRYTDSWTTFLNVRKAWAYRQDQLPSTHPIATDMVDLEAVKLNFDGITYAKGASALRQLVAWVGEDEFFAGLRAYFAKHEWGNTTLADLLTELETTSGRDLSGWTSQWLRTAGVNLLRPVVEIDSEGNYKRVVVVQEPPSAPPGLEPVLRSHRLRIGVYALAEGKLVRTDQVELDVVVAQTEVTELVGRRAGDLLLINDDDLTYAKVRLDDRSLVAARKHLGDFESALPRTLVWGAAWDMTRDAELGAGEYLDLAFSGLPAETDIGVVGQVLRQARSAIELYATPGNVAQYRSRFADFVEASAKVAEPGSDHQLAYVRAFTSAAHTPDQLAWLAGLLEGTQTLPGLAVDADLRWSLLVRLVALGVAGGSEVAAEVARDDTATGRRHAVAARSARPTAAAKSAAWDSMIGDETLPNALIEASMSGFGIPEQRDLLLPYRASYFAAIESVWANRSSEMATLLAVGLFPALLVEPETVSLTSEFLDSRDLAPGLRRVIAEGRDSLQRALRCQERDRQTTR
ncbi:MAG: aminopeptidase N [Candidatus Nanopelagicales bacterium]